MSSMHVLDGTADPSNKSHIACDECRSRKLKCSRNLAGCSRCVTERTSCHYSDRKPMGRPRKRRRDTNADAEVPDQSYGLLNHGLDDALQHSFLEPPGRESVFDALPSPEVTLSGDGQYANVFDQAEYISIPDLNAWELSQQVGLGSSFETRVIEPWSTETPSFPSSSLNEAATSGGTPCTCLSNLYLSLSTFLSLPPSSFPYSLGFLRKAATTAREVLNCQYCPTTYASALQNLMLLGTQMPLIINEYAKLLKHIDSRASLGKSISMRMGEDAPESRHLHTGTPDCPMGITVEINAQEWRKTARQVTRKDIRGNSLSDDACLTGLVNAFESRQRTWHTRFRAGEWPTVRNHHCTEDNLHDPKLHICMQIISRIKKEIEMLDLDDPT